MVLGRVNTFSQILRNSVRKLFFSEFAGSLGKGSKTVQWVSERDRSRVSERLFLYTPSGYRVG
jgi:hypothetical protein